MGNTFDAYLAGRIATEPTLGRDEGRPAVEKFRLAVDDRIRNSDGVGRDPAIQQPCHAADQISPSVVFSGGNPWSQMVRHQGLEPRTR
jgi:hypothetical protein